MPNKEREHGYFQAFLRTIPDLPSGQFVPGEAPDFVVGSPWAKAIGIEFVMFSPNERGSADVEQHHLRERVVEAAHSLHSAGGNEPADVTVHFDYGNPLLKTEVRALASALSELVAASRPAASASARIGVSPDLLPPKISDIRIRRTFKGIDPLWYPSGAGWVEPLYAATVQGAIDRKASKLADYRKKAATVWLVIVNDPFEGVPACALSPEAESASYRYAFDRVYWLDLGRSHLLRRAGDVGHAVPR